MYFVPLFKYYWHIFVIMQAFLCDEKPISYFAIILIWNSKPIFLFVERLHNAFVVCNLGFDQLKHGKLNSMWQDVYWGHR